MNGRIGMWLGKPGSRRAEYKEVNWRTDWLLVILQAVVCVLILFTDLAFAGSWVFILPPEWDWVIGMLLFISFAITAFVGDWILIRLRGYFSLDVKQLERTGWTKWNWVVWKLKQWPTWIGSIVIITCVLLFAYSVVWDWWWEYCLETPDLLVPVPIIQGGSPWMTLGVFISLIGIVSFLLHPGKYPLTLSTFGGIVVAIAHWFYPVAIWIEYRRPLLLYAIYAAWCVAWIIGTATLFVRFWLREITDAYVPAEDKQKDDSWKILEVINKLSGAGRPQMEEPQR